MTTYIPVASVAALSVALFVYTIHRTNSLDSSLIDQMKSFTQHWHVDTYGNLLPRSNNSVDIGNAEYKVRDIYEAD